jgi:hypothetical protein
MSDLLTDAEHNAMDLIAQAGRAVGAVIGDGGAPAAADFREAVTHIHALQQMVMSQAAARAYPDRYRLLGDVS